ncbi:unnamed protein product [Rotaria sp. Silwood1]|nr:unnamed protein product [Rotaria sp. Silwood1]
MKGYLHSDDGLYAFPLGPKVTTIGRENCDISITSPHIDNQHALIEYDDEQRCFILKDLNSSTGTYVHECRVQNAAVRLADGDFIRFGFNGLPLEFRIEQQQQQETTMPSIYPRQPTSNSLHLITQTIPSRRSPSSTISHQQQIDVQQNTGFSLRTRALSAGTKKISSITSTNQTNNAMRDSIVRPNAWTITSTSNPSRTLINGNFTGELDISGQDNSEITNRVGQLEKEVKGREAEIRELTDKLRSLEPLSSTFKTDVHTLRAELDKVKREKQAASGLISSLQRDLHSKESSLAKVNREIDGLKTDSRDKDLKLQSLQSKLNLLRDRSRAEEDRHNKEKEVKIKLAEQQINELNENMNRLKSQLQDTEKQLLRVNQNEQKLKQECEHTRGQLAEVKRSEATLKSDLASAQRKSLNSSYTPSTSPPPVIEAVIPVLATPVADLSQELFAYKSRVQEQEQIIVSLRRDLAGMTARLSDVQGELSEKQKHALEKSELTIREQTKELNETRLKLSKLSDIVDKQSAQMETLQSDLSKSKILVNQYQLLVDQRQADIDRLTKSLDEKNLVVEQVEKINHNEGRITHELVSIGAQCKGERHEQTIGRQREALNELRARIKSLEQLRPVNPSYEKVLQQVVLLKRELAELRARQALPDDIPYLTTTSGPNSIQQQSQRQSTATTVRQSSSATIHSEQPPQAQKIIEERAAHAETMNSLQSSDELQSTFTRKLMNLLDIDDDSLLNVTPLATLRTTDRYVALQQRQRTNEILIQKIEMLRERLTRKEELLRDYEKDLGKLRQAEILLREKDILLQDLEVDKRTKDDESLFLRNTLRETQDTLNQEKRLNSSIKLGRNVDQSQSHELIRRSGGSTATLHPHYPSDAVTSKVRTIKRDMNQKLTRKDYEIKTLKQELHEALDTLSEQSHKVKLLEIQSKTTMSNTDTNILTPHNS